EKAAHLQSLLRKRARFAWTDVQAKAFQELKDALVSAAVLAYPNKEQPFKLMTDASDIALGAVLMQWNPEENRDYVVSYASKALNPAEKNYDTTDREGLAAVWAIRRYKRYLHGRHFELFTDHKALLSIIHKLEPRSKRKARWVSELQEYDFTIWHLEGKKNVIADALSRDPKFGEKALTDRALKVRRGVLFIEKKPNQWRRVIPSPNHEEIIRSVHEQGHMGIHSTVNKIKERFWWPGISKQVAEFISTCDQCQREKKPQKAKDIYPIIASRPFEIVGIDHVGPLHETPEGYQYMIIAQDYFTKWPIVKPTKTTNMDEALKFVYEEIYTVYGKPQQLISDQGSAFTGELWNAAMKKWKINHTPTTAANPQGNGQVERFNQTLVKMLQKKLGARKNQWHLKIPGLLMDYRASVQATTGRTP
ncbi:1614_t:CDS:2, partial [Paraglomus occultum]